jgi:hypothetical protein
MIKRNTGALDDRTSILKYDLTIYKELWKS